MKSRSAVFLAALATTLAVAIPAATAAPLRTADPDPTEPGRDVAADELEAAEVTSIEPGARGAEISAATLGRGTAERTYLINLADPAVPTYTGGVPGLAPTAPDPGEQLDPDSADARAYRAHLVEEQVDLIDDMEGIVGRDVEVPFTYQNAVNGFAAVLTPDEAEALASHPDVASIALDQERELHTDSGPVWSGADALWNAADELGLPEDYRGEGIIIGTIDTGVNPGNRSFAETGGDGYTHTNPLGAGNYLGVCDPSNTEQFDPLFPCNEKLIGAYGFLSPTDNNALDYDGHGSHTASTSGGNVVNGVVPGAPPGTDPPAFDISGVAPHANVITYLGCCSLSGLTASIDQAIADGVDVINYSIGSSDPSPDMWTDFDTLGFLNARAAGIFVATSNGNDGPGFATTGSPSDAPWITSVGASTHNRHAFNSLTNLTSSAGTLPDITGKSLTGPLPSTPIVYAGDFGDPLCQATTGNEANFTGNIVACDRGVNGRIEKSENVAAQGAIGYVLMNDEPNGNSVLGDPYAVPGVFISYDDGVALKDWLATGSDHQAAISGTTFTVDDALGDTMISFSSRGPNRAIDTLVPDVTAPGVDILAAHGVGQPDNYSLDQHEIISGTSMASPHVAGAGALLSQARPDWTPAEQQSALMTTARTSVTNHDGTPATPYAQGSGHIDIGAAVQAGLLFDETHANYLAANPAEGGDPKTLNLPSFANTQCLDECSWERTATVPDSAPAGVTWTASVVTDDGLTLGVSLAPDPATVSPGDSLDISVAADVGGAPTDETLFGRITLTPSDAGVPSVTMPVAVVPTAGVLPGEVAIETRRNAGSQLVSGIESIEVTEFTGSVQGFVPATLEEGSLDQDPTNGDPYDDLGQVDVYLLDVPAGGSRLVAEMVDWEMPDADMFVGTGDTPSLATEVCSSTSSSSAEVCDIADPDAGTWWVLVQNWGGSDAQPDAYTLATAVVPGDDLGNGGIAGPDGPVPAGEPYDIRVHWDIPEMAAGERWYGTAVLGSSPATPGDIGSFPVTIHRADDDVTKTASVPEATVGDTISYEVTVQPNVTPEDLVYTITDTVPEGLTIDPASVTGGGVVDGQTISWEVELPTAVDAGGDYEYTTSLTDPACVSPLGGYFDLNGQLGFQPAAGVEGDVGVFTFLSSTPFHFYGENPTGLGVTPHGFVLQGGDYGGAPWVPQGVPDPAVPNGLVAPLWADTEIIRAEGAPGEERGVTVASSAALAIVEFDRLQMFDQPDQVLGSYQLVTLAQADPTGADAWIVFDTPGFLPTDTTVGIEDAEGARGTQVTESLADLWVPGNTICLDFVGETFDPVTVGYDVAVDADAVSGTYTNAAVHTTDDPFAQEATASADVEIEGAVGVECDQVIDGRHVGALTVTEGTTCLEGARVTGPVNVGDGAGLRSDDGSRITGSVLATGAAEITLCDTRITGPVTLTDGSAVTVGDPTADCAGNTVVGSVNVSGTDGPTVIADNRIIGSLACSSNDPPPVNNGFPNTVLGSKGGQCAEL
jgi:uncharacterized repeat protein (TIGR01451 family)